MTAQRACMHVARTQHSPSIVERASEIGPCYPRNRGCRTHEFSRNRQLHGALLLWATCGSVAQLAGTRRGRHGSPCTYSPRLSVTAPESQVGGVGALEPVQVRACVCLPSLGMVTVPASTAILLMCPSGRGPLASRAHRLAAGRGAQARPVRGAPGEVIGLL